MALTSSTNPKNQNPGSKVLTQFAVGVRFSSLNTVQVHVVIRKENTRKESILCGGEEPFNIFQAVVSIHSVPLQVRGLADAQGQVGAALGQA